MGGEPTDGANASDGFEPSTVEVLNAKGPRFVSRVREEHLETRLASAALSELDDDL